MQKLLKHLHVNIPFTMLYDSYLELFLQNELNPEIGIDALALDRFSVADFQLIAKKLQAYSPDITLHGPFIDLSPGSLDPAVRQLTRHRFEQLLQLVDIFNPAAVVCHAGYDRRRYGFHREEWLDNSLELWSWMGSSLQAHSASLMLENVYEDGPEDIRILFERLDHRNIGFCLDPGHLVAFGQASVEDWIESMEPYLGQLHLHDNQGVWDDHMALGHGKIDFHYIFDYLKTKRSKPPIVTLEPHEEEAFWPSVEYLRKIWPW
jgi:sugar phosphate isomerase/epimerase